MRAQGRKEPVRRAGHGRAQLVPAPAPAPAGSRQGEEGASVSDVAGTACPQRPTWLRGGLLETMLGAGPVHCGGFVHVLLGSLGPLPDIALF